MKRITIDKEKCVTCHACELVCSFEKTAEFNLKQAAIRINITDNRTGDSQMVVCRQCQKPACVEACKAEALVMNTGNESDKGRVIQFVDDNCISCGQCIDACPFSAIFQNPADNKPIRCDLCGGNPRCILYCQKEALTVL